MSDDEFELLKMVAEKLLYNDYDPVLQDLVYRCQIDRGEKNANDIKAK